MKGFVPNLKSEVEISSNQDFTFIELGVKQEKCEECDCVNGECTHKDE